MNKEEAIRIFRKEIECLSHAKCEDCILEKVCDPAKTTPYDSEYIEAYGMALQALSQEPQCTEHPCLGTLCRYYKEPCNAVSRILTRMWNCRGKRTTSIDKVAMEQIIREELSPVNPKPTECDDAVSREAVIMECIKYADHEYNVQLKKEVSETRKHDAQVIIYACDYFKTFVEKLPSVTHKSGKWMKSRCDMYVCSECDHIYTDLSGERYGMHYCPNCGAKMESEE